MKYKITIELIEPEEEKTYPKTTTIYMQIVDEDPTEEVVGAVNKMTNM